MKKLLFTNTLALGDIVLLTAAVRDLHRAFPGVFATDVRTTHKELWRHNPHLTPLDEYDPDVRVVACSYPLIKQSDRAGVHALHGFIGFLNQYLGGGIRLTEFKGDVYLSPVERRSCPLVTGETGEAIPFWLINAGGDRHYTTKWWESARYQAVVDHFRGRIQFVQVGAAGDHHPKLRGVIDLRGRTSARDLVRLVHHAQGVLCGVTGLMHLAAAVPVKGSLNRLRPCVVVAGGREPAQWEAYPGHQYIHTIGALPCCAAGGCWRARTRPLGDGHEFDRPNRICLDARGDLPRCMDLISAEEVIRRIETYFTGGTIAYLTKTQARAGARGAAATVSHDPDAGRLTVENSCAAVDCFIAEMPPCPNGFTGRGVVICAGGVHGFTNAWVCVNMLRRAGCRLPVELWHLGEEELDAEMKALVQPLGVACVDARQVQKRYPADLPHPWALKPYAILHSAFREVLLLDMDNVPVANPEFLFDTPQFAKAGAIFWPDYGRLGPERSIWKACGVKYRDEPEFESGQIVVDKERCWRPLRLALWFNERANFFYQHIHGDKDTFHMAFHKLRRPYAMPATPIHRLPYTMCQHDFDGRRIFQHRNTDKWNLFLRNRRIRGFLLEAECRQAIRELSRRWDGRIKRHQPETPRRDAADEPRVEVSAAEVRIHACLLSCREREQMREQTLGRLRQTDWGERPVAVHLDSRRFVNRQDNYAYDGWMALQAGLRTDAEFILYLEDDSRFNRHFLHNLTHWWPVRERHLTLGTFYNPGLRELACDVARNLAVLDPQCIFGSHAILLSRSTVKFIVEHWKEEPLAIDLRVARLAGRLGQPVYAHSPSLVQHLGRKSTWGGGFHQAPDFDANWKARS